MKNKNLICEKNVPNCESLSREIYPVFIRESFSREYLSTFQVAKVYSKNFASFLARKSFYDISVLQGAGHIKNTVVLVFQHTQCLHLMYFGVAWVVVSSGTQVRPQRIIDPDSLPDYLSVSFDYENTM